MMDDTSSGTSAALKRQREPLSDAEDNVLFPADFNDSQKRRRLDVIGQENRSPKPSSFSRQAELDVKGDTPNIVSVRSRVQQLTQYREGGPLLAQRCLSDPGSDTPSIIIQDKTFKEHLLGEVEFSQRVERFRAANLQPSPARTPNPANPSSLTLSSAVTCIQQRLQGSTTPSSKQASRLRQERDEELRLLCSQPISDNAWLKRSMSDPSLNEVDGDEDDGTFPAGLSVTKDGSFTQALVPGTGAPDAADDTLDKHSDESVASKSASVPALAADGDGGTATTERDEREEGREAVEEPEGAMDTESEPRVGPVLEEPEERSQRCSSASQQGEEGAEVFQGQSEADKERRSSVVGSQRASEDAPGSVTKTSGQKENPRHVTVSPLSEELRSSSVSESSEEGCVKEDRLESGSPSQVDVWEGMESDEELTALGSDLNGELSPGSQGSDGERGGEVESPSPSQRWVVSPLYEVLGDKSALAVTAKVLDSLSTHQDKGLSPDELAVKDLESSDAERILSLACSGPLVKEFPSCASDSDLTDIGEVETDNTWQIQSSTAKKSQGGQGVATRDLGQNAADLHKETTSNPGSVQIEIGRGTHSDSTEQHVGAEVVGIEKTRQQVTAESTDPEHKAMEIQPEERQTAVVEKHRAPASGDKRDQITAQHSDGGEAGLATRAGEEEGATEEKRPESRCGGLKTVTFVLKPELIDGSDLDTSTESRAEASLSEADASGHDETNTAEMIDQMFEEVLEAAGQTAEKGEEGGGADEHDSGIVLGSGEKKMKKRERQEEERACEGTKEEEDTSGDEMLTFPRCGILSPLSKSVETVVTPMRLAAGQLSNTPSLLLSPDDDVTPGPADSAPLYSIDAYRTQRQKKLPAMQSVTPSVQRRGQEKSRPQPSVNTKERIAGLNEEAGKLQTVISQTLQALSCCTDEGHGRGSMEEAEAEKLLLVSSEKRSALLSEVARLKETDSVEPEESDGDYIAQQPCRGTVGISQVQLPLKVEFVCSSRNRTGRPSHYFFVLIRYGSCNIVATPLATALDALNGDTITFSTSVTLQDIRPSFEIDVEVYSLSHTSSSAGTVERGSTKSRLTPRKILKTKKKSNPSSTSSALPALNTRRSSNFSLVGSHKITLASLGQSKFPLDKMKFEGKIRRLLGDEFQEKVPFLSPLEGNIYLHLDSHGHSNVQHQGFLTMFEVINGFGAWHRRFFVLEGEQMSYWNHPNDRGSKLPEGSISLSSASSQTVKPVKRDSCARPFTFELVSDLQSQEPDDLSTKAKCWFSADTKEERSDWTEKLNQVLLDLHTWTRRVPAHSDAEVSQTTSTSSFSSTVSTIRESTL